MLTCQRKESLMSDKLLEAKDIYIRKGFLDLSVQCLFDNNRWIQITWLRLHDTFYSLYFLYSIENDDKENMESTIEAMKKHGWLHS